MDQLYREVILDHYKNPRNFGDLESPDAEFHDRNPLCGDEMGVHIKLEGDRIADLRFHGTGCAISQALPHPPQVRPALAEGRAGSAAWYGRVAHGYARRGPGRGRRRAAQERDMSRPASPGSSRNSRLSEFR